MFSMFSVFTLVEMFKDSLLQNIPLLNEYIIFGNVDEWVLIIC